LLADAATVAEPEAVPEGVKVTEAVPEAETPAVVDTVPDAVTLAVSLWLGVPLGVWEKEKSGVGAMLEDGEGDAGTLGEPLREAVDDADAPRVSVTVAEPVTVPLGEMDGAAVSLLLALGTADALTVADGEMLGVAEAGTVPVTDPLPVLEADTPGLVDPVMLADPDPEAVAAAPCEPLADAEAVAVGEQGTAEGKGAYECWQAGCEPSGHGAPPGDGLGYPAVAGGGPGTVVGLAPCGQRNAVTLGGGGR